MSRIILHANGPKKMMHKVLILIPDHQVAKYCQMTATYDLEETHYCAGFNPWISECDCVQPYIHILNVTVRECILIQPVTKAPTDRP